MEPAAESVKRESRVPRAVAADASTETDPAADPAEAEPSGPEDAKMDDAGADPGDVDEDGYDDEPEGSQAQDGPTEDEDEDLAPRPRRQALTAFELRLIVNELQVLVGGWLDKAYQPSREEVLLRFRAPEVGRRDLFARRGAHMFFAATKPDNPTHPPGFAMALRKYVGGGRVFKIEQAGYDRVVTVHIQRKEGEYRIVFELFGDGNCILVRPGGKILLPLVQESWASRTIRGGAPYVPPPARDDPFEIDAATFVAKARQGNADVVRALAMEVALQGPVAEEVLLRTGIDKGTPIDDVSDAQLHALFAAWDELRSFTVTDGPRPDAFLLLEEGRPIDAFGYDSLRVKAEVERSQGRLELRPMPSFSAALDALFLRGRRAAKKAEQVAAVQGQMTKLERQRKAQEQAIEKFSNDIVEKGLQGELLFAHYQTVERIREQLLGARKSLGWKEIRARLATGRKEGNPDAAVIHDVQPDQGIVLLDLPDADGKTHRVPLDITKNVTENAQKAYDRSKAARSKLKGAREALESSLAKIKAAEESRDKAEVAVEDAMHRETHFVTAERHNWFEAFRWFFASTGELVVGGRDAATNDRLVKKHLDDGDRYVHADIHGAPSCVVKAVEGPPKEASLEEAAQLAVTYSRAFGRAGSADAYWVTPPQVSKTPQAGEFLARGAFIVRGERHYVRKVPLETCLGIVWLSPQGRPEPAPDAEAIAAGTTRARAKLMGGPPPAVHAHADVWVDLVAGDVPRARMGKALAQVFGAHPDSVERNLPVGDLQVARAKGVSDEALRAALGGKE